MDIDDDKIHISTIPFDTRGQKIEPEEQSAARVLSGTIGVGPQGGAAVGALPAQIVAESTVGEIARAIRSTCGRCRHFDNRGWNRVLVHKDGSEVRADREEINALRGALLQTMNAELSDVHAGADGDLDVEHALRSMGLCRVLTEQANEGIVVHPMSSCPEEARSPTQPDGYFAPRDDESERSGNAIYDQILQKAQGKIR